MAAGLMAGAASASAHGPFPGPGTTAMTLILSDNVPGNGGVWAIDSVWRTATVTVAGGFPVPPWHCGWNGWGPRRPAMPLPPSCMTRERSARTGAR